MRIAMVSPYDLSVPGGVQGQVTGLRDALRGLGHEVVVVAPGRRSPGDGGDTVVVGRAVGVRANGSVAPVAIWPTAAARAARAIRHANVDVVHLHEPLAPVVNYGCLLAARQPMVGTFHRNGSSALYRVLGPLAGWALGRLAARCAVSESARDNAASSLGGDYEVLFNGIDVDRFRTDAPTPTTAPTVLFLGRHEPRKGLAFLLRAFEAVTPPAVLWVAGEGPATAELQRRHPPSATVQWLGAITEEEKVARMAGADVFCAPSLGGESFGMVLLEAMAAGCALVASDIDGYRTAADGQARLVPPGDAAALARALDEALADASAGRGLSSPEARESARARAEQWSMGRLAARYVEIYERVLAGAPGRDAPGRPVA
jgi:phosphatidylinositol alpha-mannosyltransferase